LSSKWSISFKPPNQNPVCTVVTRVASTTLSPLCVASPSRAVSLGWAYYGRYEAKPEIPAGQGMSGSVSQSEASWSARYLRGLEDTFRLCERRTHVRNLTVNSIVCSIHINIQVSYTFQNMFLQFRSYTNYSVTNL
jgi:hypothetical protein